MHAASIENLSMVQSLGIGLAMVCSGPIPFRQGGGLQPTAGLSHSASQTVHAASEVIYQNCDENASSIICGALGR
jgi:hypothetical protein